MTLQFDLHEYEYDTIEKLSFSVDENNLELQGSFTEKAALLKLWKFDTDNGEPLVFQEFQISRPVLHHKEIYHNDTIELVRKRDSLMNSK